MTFPGKTGGEYKSEIMTKWSIGPAIEGFVETRPSLAASSRWMMRDRMVTH